ncbi:hypothetical protein ACFQE1_07140 [Halobium palmae]|uniref:DUF8049 domain-containing protein n=1 Tax=Halobium palmae TaxID=1776492 RepID=A0ABD5RY92_9EURY
MSSTTESGVPDDVIVAAVASGCTVGLHLVLSFLLDVESSLFVRLAPLAVYFLYTFVHHGGREFALDTPRNWSLLAVGVSLVVVAAYLL